MSKRNQIRKRERYLKRDIVEVETFHECPPLQLGGFIETKKGRDCLRLPDSMEWVPETSFRVERRWRFVPKGVNINDLYMRRV
jgi:hypothetical protein